MILLVVRIRTGRNSKLGVPKDCMYSNTSNDQRQEHTRGQYIRALAYVNGVEKIILDDFEIFTLQKYRVFGTYPLPSIVVDLVQ